MNQSLLIKQPARYVCGLRDERKFILLRFIFHINSFLHLLITLVKPHIFFRTLIVKCHPKIHVAPFVFVIFFKISDLCYHIKESSLEKYEHIFLFLSIILLLKETKISNEDCQVFKTGNISRTTDQFNTDNLIKISCTAQV